MSVKVPRRFAPNPFPPLDVSLPHFNGLVLGINVEIYIHYILNYTIIPATCNESCVDNTVLDCSQPSEENLQTILRKEVQIAVASLKKGKSAGVDNIPAELVQAGGETMIDVLTEICNRIFRTGEWPTPCTQSLIITLPKKGNLQLCQNYRTISLISHLSKAMLKVILNRL